MDGTETGRSASRQIQELVNAGYVGSSLDEQKKRLLYICEIDSKIKKAPNIETPRDTPLLAPKPEPENTLPDDKLIASKEDGITVWNKSRAFWNEKGLKPECRDIMMRAGDTSDILRTMQNYTWDEIKNAIGNYAWHKKQPASEYSDPPPYGSLAGFLKTGVERYFDDNALDQQFKKEEKIERNGRR